MTKKKSPYQSSSNFRQQESTARKIESNIHIESQKQLTQTAALIKSETPNREGKFKLKTKDYAKGTLVIASKSLKSGAKKYQGELEKGDAEGVTLTSKSATATIKTIKLSVKTIQKLKEKRLESKNFKKAKENPLHKAKPKEINLKKISPIPVSALKSGAVKYQSELEKGDAEGVKLASQSATQIARATKKLSKGESKINAQSSKLNKQNTKLIQLDFNKNKQLKKESKAILKKKVYKKKLYYAPNKKKTAYTGVLSSFSNRIKDIFQSLGKLNLANIKSLISAKIAAYAGSGLISILPFILVAVVILILVGVLGGGQSQQQQMVGSRNLSPEVEQWRSVVETETAAQGMEAYVGLILAIIQVETGGKGTRDIMQSSESAGFPVNYWSTEELSVRQGVKHLKNIVNMVQPFGLENDYKLLAQAYNFGSYFATYVTNLGGIYNLDVAEGYSREVVAPSLGNNSGQTYSYVNATSQRLGKTYLYRNGGNFMYGELVSEYLGGNGAGVTGDFAIVVEELGKYLGWEYVWGGKSPSTGFDCSGFVSWGLAQIGIDLPSYAASQYDLTVPIDPSEAQPGDLIFFKGTYGGANHVSHVGFYIDESTMLDSNGSGVGYHNWKSSYWQSHYAGIHRVVR